MKPILPSFWVTNISPMNVSLADLNLTIKSFSSVNLLDKRHYQYTLEQLTKSVESGSIFKKRDKIVVRKNAPEIIKNTIPINKESVIPSRERSIFKIEEKEYEELKITEEDKKLQEEMFAKEAAELTDINPTDSKKV